MKAASALGLTLVSAIVLIYSSVFLGGAFGVNDDYQYLQRVYAGTFDPANNEQTGMGRPAAAWLLNAGYKLCAGSVGNLVYLRLAALAGVCLLAAALHGMVCRAGQARGAALMTALGVAFSPACGVYAGWAAAFLCPYALLLCLLAGRALQDFPADRAARWRRIGGAAGLILVACSLWQAAAPLALFAGFADAWDRQRPNTPGDPAADARRLLSAWAVVVASVLAYLLAQRLGVRLGWVHGSGVERLTLSFELRAKVRLLGELLRSGFTSWARLHSLAWEMPVAGLTLLACAAAARTRFQAGLAAVMILASISPLLVASENNASFRALPVLYTTVTFLAVEGIARLLRRAPDWTRLAAPGALAAVLAACAAYHVRVGIVVPNAREYRAVGKLVARQFREMPAQVVYLPPPPLLLAPESMKPSWEYGLVSSPFWWVTKPFLLDIFRARGLGPAPAGADLEIFYREVGHPGVPVLNPMPEMLREPGRWRDDPHWGRVLAFSHGWIYSPWFGYFNDREFPVLQHHILGALLYIGGQGDEIWLHKEGLGNFYTSKVSFPYLFVNERRDWVCLLDADRSHCAVRDAAGHRVPLTE